LYNERIGKDTYHGVDVAKLEFGAISEISGTQTEKVPKIIMEMELLHFSYLPPINISV
jgi:hypothetical protein